MKQYKIYIVFFLSFIFNNLKSQNYFSKSNLKCFNSVSVSGGFLSNQANHNKNAYKPNKTALFQINATVIQLKNLNYLVGLGYRKKSMIGYGNYAWMRFVNNLEPSEISPFQTNYNLGFNYVNVDNQVRISFLEKYKVNPFVFIGARFNKLLNYSDSLNYYNLHVNDQLILRDNYFNLFYGLGCQYLINKNLSIHLLGEVNHDNIPGRQVFFNSESKLKEKEIRFLSYSLQLGLCYKLKRKTE